MNVLKIEDGEVPTTRNAPVKCLYRRLTLISVQVHYTAIRNELSL